MISRARDPGPSAGITGGCQGLYLNKGDQRVSRGDLFVKDPKSSGDFSDKRADFQIKHRCVLSPAKISVLL